MEGEGACNVLLPSAINLEGNKLVFKRNFKKLIA